MLDITYLPFKMLVIKDFIENLQIKSYVLEFGTKTPPLNNRSARIRRPCGTLKETA